MRFFKVLLAACLLLLFPVSVSASTFCGRDFSDLSKQTRDFMILDTENGGTVEGMCIADDYMIVTRFTDNHTDTTYEVYDLKTMTEVGSSSFATIHSNSLAYNPKRNELVVTSGTDNSTLFFFRFKDGILTYKRQKSMPCYVTGLCYASSEDAYYFTTGRRVFASRDFNENELKFTIEDQGTTQGFASDGEYLYFCWTTGDGSKIVKTRLTGEVNTSYTLSREACHEIEEIDFYKSDMYIADNKVGNDKIYTVPSRHSYGEYKVTKETSCSEPGVKVRTCSKCGYVDTQEIPCTEHSYGNYRTIEKSTCSTEGYKERICKVCQYKDMKLLPLDASRHTPVTKTEEVLGDEHCKYEVTCCEECGKILSKELVTPLGRKKVE